MVDVYDELAHHIDALPSGLHVSGGGIEPQTLRQLFSRKEAELALHLTLVPEDPLHIARRARIAENEAERRLKEMEQRGLIVSASAEDSPQASAATRYALGVWRFHVNDMSPGHGRVPALPI